MQGKRIHYTEIAPKRFDQEPAQGVEGRVLIGKEDGAGKFCMRAFVVEPGGHTPRHAHDWEHEIFIHAGRGRMLFGEEWKEVEPGCAVFIPGNLTHQIENTGGESLTVICLIPAGPPEL
ncbi:MAG: cupin domain-containing protein [Proteobacteria bacterium]|nr:cupin domain-containing protein [Pseudomonadota bacterium]